MMFPRAHVALALVVSTVGAFGCAGAPRTKPLPTKPIESGTGTLQEARTFLEGRWSLMSFEVRPRGAAPIPVKGAGTLTYDDFGNLRMDLRTDAATAAKLAEVGIEMPKGVLSTEGRTAIDLQNRTLTYILPGQPAPGERAGPLALNRPRHWEVNGDVLTLTTKGDDGAVLSVATWKKQ